MRTDTSDRLLIGNIVRELEQRMPEGVGSNPTPRQVELVSEVYTEFDARYQDRPDYKLWRVAVTPYFAIRRSGLMGGQTEFSIGWDDWSKYAEECATSADPLLAWAAVALAPDLIESRLRRFDIGDDAPIWRFADGLRTRLRHLPPLPQCPASCGIAAAMFLLRHQNLHYKAGRQLQLAGCETFCIEFERWLTVADASWQPGVKLNAAAVVNERRKRGRLRAAHDAYEFTRLAQMMSILRPVLSHNVTTLDSRSEVLLEKAYRYALSAWLTARSRRIDEMRFQEQRGHSTGDRARVALRKAFREEFACHLKLSNAARDAGHYLDSAKYLYLLYRLIPDQFAKEEFLKKELEEKSATYRYIGEVGLEVDPRFNVAQDPDLIAHSANRAARLWQGKGAVAPAPGHDCVTVEPLDEKGFMLRVRRDQARMPQWKILLAEIPKRPNETPAGYLLTVVRGLADNGFEASPTALSAAFDISLRYGFVRSAGKILARSIRENAFSVSPAMIGTFVREVRRCTQLDPFGIRQERLTDWQGLIRDACYLLLLERGARRWMTARDRLWVHETLMNRTVVQHRSLSLENARRLFEKTIGAHDIGQLREFYDLSYDFHRRAPGAANVQTIADYLRNVPRGPLPKPVAVSLMRMGDAVSIVAIAGDGRAIADDVQHVDLDADVAGVVAGAEHWFRFEPFDNEDEIGWPRSFRRLATQVLQIAQECDPSARVLLVSMDTSIAALPWQNLIGLIGGPDWLVSIVPSLSALTLPVQEQVLPGSKVLLSDEALEEVEQVVHEVRRTTAERGLERSSLFIAVAHGAPPQPGGLPALRLGSLGDIGSLDAWIPLLGARVNLFHCCHAGAPRPLFMEEFGGLAGLAICLGSKTVVAPVAEVLASTAISMQHSLFADVDHPIGAGYLDAVRTNASCTLYNLYGDPFQCLRAGLAGHPLRKLAPPEQEQSFAGRAPRLNSNPVARAPDASRRSS